MSIQDHASIVRTFFDSFNNHDLASAVALVADDCEWVDVAAGMTLPGKEGCRQWLQSFLTALPDGQTELTNIVAAGEWVFTEHTGRGTHTGPFRSPAGEIPPTGKAVELQFAEVYKVTNGRITLLRAYYDTATLMRQLGVLPLAL